MLIRIVRMTFQPEKVDEFVAVFDTYKSKIRSAPGCTHLQLWNDVHEPNVFCTYSHWESEQDLNNYRHSDTFAEVWPRTKSLFLKPPQAWSNQVLRELV
ncbi:MAG: antibiotic biosynthesis monooxygenase [Flavobacteriales bacterium]|nr:antibiotic biosynthesis monooxygenase [Flavobacteriales bacterium]